MIEQIKDVDEEVASQEGVEYPQVTSDTDQDEEDEEEEYPQISWEINREEEKDEKILTRVELPALLIESKITSFT